MRGCPLRAAAFSLCGPRCSGRLALFARRARAMAFRGLLAPPSMATPVVRAALAPCAVATSRKASPVAALRSGSPPALYHHTTRRFAAHVGRRPPVLPTVPAPNFLENPMKPARCALVVKSTPGMLGLLSQSVNRQHQRSLPMAIITPGVAIAAASGSVGGTVFSRNKGGAYMRNRSIPTDPSTSAQLSRRAILSSQSQAWADLTDAQRANWANYATQNPVTNALGHSILLSGHQAFVQINARLDLADDPTLTSPPIINAPLALDTLVLDGDIGAGDVDVTFTATPLAGSTSLWLEAAVVNSAGVTFVKNLFRFIGQSADAQASPFDIQSLVETKFGTLIVGQRLFVKVGTFDAASGLKSVSLEDSVTITTT